jgi:spermidine synthase
MVFFQGVLLGGYVFAHVTLARVPAGVQVVGQLALLAVAVATLPIVLPSGWQAPGGKDPIVWTLLALAAMVGAPFFMLSTVGPTLQRWFSETTHPRAGDPYFLYAAGNVGSLLALLAYPFLIEQRMPLSLQASAWTFLYVALVLACAGCALLRSRHRASSAARLGKIISSRTGSVVEPVPLRRTGRWVMLAFIPSALMLGVTRHLATDIAAVPLLWVVPLSLYLLTFIAAFGRDPDKLVHVSARVFRILVVPLAISFLGIIPSLWVQLPLQLCGFTAAALVVHGLLAFDRPAATHLTRFYVSIAVGGLLGGVFAALLAPLVFTTVLEYPIAIVLALAVLPRQDRHSRRRRRIPLDARGVTLSIGAVAIAVATVVIRRDGTERSLTVAMVAASVGLLAAYGLARRPAGFAAAVGALLLLVHTVPADETLFADRTFFGVTRVYAAPDGSHVLLSGTTVHGVEDVVDGQLVGTPSSYYARQGPAGDVFATLRDASPLRAGVIGAGAGTLAAYLEPVDSMTFFEIDQAVVDVASDPTLFSYVTRSAGEVAFVLGDGRVELQRSRDAFDLIVVDAFSGDAIPTHLLTLEAVRLYRSHLSDDGLMAFHVSNRYFDLTPVIARTAADERLAGVVRHDVAATHVEGALPSTWIVLAEDRQHIAPLSQHLRWTSLDDAADGPLWTDDHADLLAALR